MPKPVLQAMVLADHVYQDRMTGKFIIAGTFASILLTESQVTPVNPSATDPGEAHRVVGPISRMGSPYLYIALAEVHGEVPLDVKYVDLSDASVLLEARIVVSALSPLLVAEYVVPLPPLPAMKIGTYSRDLLYDSEILGSWRVTVGKFPGQTGGAKELT